MSGWQVSLLFLLNTALVALIGYPQIGTVIALILLSVVFLRSVPESGLAVLLLMLTLPLYVYSIGLFAFAVCLLAGRLVLSRGLNISLAWSTLIPALALLSLVTIGIVQSSEGELAIRYGRLFYEGVLVYLIAFAFLNSLSLAKIERGLIGSVYLVSLVLLLKGVFWISGEAGYIHEIADQLNTSGLSLEKRLNVEVEGRAFSRLILPGQEPNYACAILVLFFGLSLSLWPTRASRGSWWRAALCLSAIGAQVIGTYSRAGMLSLLIIIFLTFVVDKKRHLGWFFAVGAAAAVFFGVLQSSIIGRLITIPGELLGGGSGRYDLWLKSVDFWSRAPLLGHGAGSSYVYLQDAAHNTWLTILIEYGLLGLFLVVLILFTPILIIIRRITISGCSPTVLGLLTGYLGHLVMITTVTMHDIKISLLFAAIVTVVGQKLGKVQHVDRNYSRFCARVGQ